MTKVTVMTRAPQVELEAIRRAVATGVLTAFDRLTNDQVRQLIRAPYIELAQDLEMEASKAA